MTQYVVAWMTILSLSSVLAAHSRLDQVCDPRGLSEDPPLCWQSSPRRYLPNVYGGPATLDQCVFGHPKLARGIFNSCSSGALFGFSGIDGPTNSASKMLGWFVNGSYSVHLWLNNPRFLRLGFGGNSPTHLISHPRPLVDGTCSHADSLTLPRPASWLEHCCV